MALKIFKQRNKDGGYYLQRELTLIQPRIVSNIRVGIVLLLKKPLTKFTSPLGIEHHYTFLSTALLRPLTTG